MLLNGLLIPNTFWRGHLLGCFPSRRFRIWLVSIFLPNFTFFFLPKFLESQLHIKLLFDNEFNKVKCRQSNLFPDRNPINFCKINVGLHLWTVIGIVWGFHGVTVRHVSTKKGSSSGLFLFADSEAAGIVSEHCGLIWNYFREDSWLIVTVFTESESWTVCKDIFPHWVTMEIQK